MSAILVWAAADTVSRRAVSRFRPGDANTPARTCLACHALGCAHAQHASEGSASGYTHAVVFVAYASESKAASQDRHAADVRSIPPRPSVSIPRVTIKFFERY